MKIFLETVNYSQELLAVINTIAVRVRQLRIAIQEDRKLAESYDGTAEKFLSDLDAMKSYVITGSPDSIE